MTNPAERTESSVSALAPAPATSYLSRPGGRIGYDVAGQGPLGVLVPGRSAVACPRGGPGMTGPRCDAPHAGGATMTISQVLPGTGPAG